jgi:hypothetical protein
MAGMAAYFVILAAFIHNVAGEECLGRTLVIALVASLLSWLFIRVLSRLS